MKTCLYNGYMNPFAYQVFPQLYDIQPKTDDFIEQARFNGTLRVISMSDESDDLIFTNTDKIDLSPFAGKEIRISLDNQQGGVILGGWVLPKKIEDIPEEDNTETEEESVYTENNNLNEEDHGE